MSALMWNENNEIISSQFVFVICSIAVSCAFITPFMMTRRPRNNDVKTAIKNYFNSALYKLEGSIANKKVNKNRDTKFSPKHTVASDEEYNRAKKTKTFDHSKWDRIMRTYVSPGNVEGITTNVVDYKALAKDPKFDSYCASLQTADLSSLHPNDQLALYINAYNALCIGHVLRYYKTNNELPKSINNAGEGKTEVWDLDAGIVAGEMVSLDDIENKILRSRWNEPRVHASIVCASASCPYLRQEAFVASKLNEQMDDQSRQWMADPTKGIKVDVKANVATFSRIFLWFKNDFSQSGGPVGWAQQYMDETFVHLEDIRHHRYFTYNWNLNYKA